MKNIYLNFYLKKINMYISYFLFIIHFFIFISSMKYPKNKNITKTPKYKDIKSIDIKNTNELVNYIKNYD